MTTHCCPVCSEPSEINFDLSNGDRPNTFMVLENEFVGLSDISSRLYCEACGWEQHGVLRDLVVDLTLYRITAGEFIPE